MKNWIITSIFLLCINLVFSQGFPEGIPYQAQVHGLDGGFLSDATIGVEFNIRSAAIDGEIAWQERHVVTLNELGHFATNIGEGTATGTGTSTSFAEIDWAGDIYFLEMLIDIDNIGSFVSRMTKQMMAVPFAFHSKTTSQEFNLSELGDVDATGISIGDILTWDGVNWVPTEDLVPDTVNFAYNSDVANYADTVTFAHNCDDITLVDSTLYAYYSDSANFAFEGNSAFYSDSASYADTAGVTTFAYNNWGISGNDNVNETDHFLGTIDSVDLVFKSYNTERMRIKANGLIGFGTADPLSEFHVNNVNGALFTGEFGSGAIPIEGAGSRMMFFSNKAAFRSGEVTGAQWNAAFIGDYSFASGYNARAAGDYGVAFGFNTTASGEGAMAMGNASISSGDYAFAVGHNPQATGDHAIAIGRGALAHAESAVAIGYHPTADAPYALSLGNYTYAHGESSVAIGYHAEALHDGSFIFNDKIDALGYVETTAENQFMVKASGGTVFYTDADLTTGVELIPGSGAWSILSDRERKENIVSIDAQDYLQRLDQIDVYEWSYISQDSSIRHIGPMAQDFHKTFELGTDSTTINSGDFDGINLLLIKALDEKMALLETQAATLEGLETELAELKAQREKLFELLMKLEQKMGEEELTEESFPEESLLTK